MGTTLDKVNKILESKNSIKDVMSASNAGLDVPTKFSEYGAEIQKGFNRLQISPLKFSISTRTPSEASAGSPANPLPYGKILVGNTPSTYSIDSSITALGANALTQICYNNQTITKVDLSNVLSLSVGSLSQTFRSTYNVTEVDLRNVVFIQSGSTNSAFRDCKALKKVYLNNLGKYYYPRSVGESPTPYSTRPIETNSMLQTFYGCLSLEEVHLDNSTHPMPLTFGQDSATNYPFYNTNSTFKIIVPDGTVDAWKAETGWSVYADHFISVSDFYGT